MPRSPIVVQKPSFDAEESAKNFHKAFKGFGTDEKLVVKEITSHSNAQRQEVKQKYLGMYGNSLEHDMKNELNGKLEDVCLALLKPRFDFDAHNLRKAINGFGTNVRVVVEILCTKDGQEISLLKEAYSRLYGKSLEDELENEEHGDLGRLFRALVSGSRPTSNGADVNLANQEAQQLWEMAQSKLSFLKSDDSELTRILSSRSFAQLRATFDAYSKLSGTDIEDSIKAATYGEFEKALVTIIRSVRNRPGFFARQIEKAMDGVGTKDEDLIRLIVSRSEVDIIDIRREYKALYNKCLYERLIDELPGQYETVMIALVGKD